MTRLCSIDNLASLVYLLLHDLLLLCSFLLRHPVILTYVFLLSPYLFRLIFLISPLLFSTSLLLLALLTVPTQLCEPPPSTTESTWGAVLYILHVGPVPDESKACLTEQLCSMLLAVSDRVSQISPSQSYCFSNAESMPENKAQSMEVTTPVYRTEHSLRRAGLLRRDNSASSQREWKKTLACKLFEERMTYKLCADRKGVEGTEGMDLLWEAYEADAHKAQKPGRKEQRGRKEEKEEDDDDEECIEVGMLGRMCCLKAVRFSAGKTRLMKISMAVKKVALFHPSGRRSRGRSCKS